MGKFKLGIGGTVLAMIVVAAIVGVGILWGTGNLPQPTGGQVAAIVSQMPTNAQTGQPLTSGMQGAGAPCPYNVSPVIRVISNNKYTATPYADATINFAVYINDSNFGSGVNGAGATGVTVPANKVVYLFADSATVYGVLTSSFDVDCQPLIPVAVSMATEGTLTTYTTNQSPNSSGNQVNATGNAPDINSANTTYLFTVYLQETTSQAAFGNPNSTKKVNWAIDYNGLDFQSVTLAVDGVTQPAGVIPPTITRDTNATAQVSFTVPASGLENNAIKAVSITSKNTATRAWTTPNLSRLRAHLSDYTFFVNTQTGKVEEGVYNPSSGADVGATDVTVDVYYR